MKKIIKIILFVISFLLMLFLLQNLFIPKYQTDLIEGSFTSEYYDEIKDHEVIFIGDCEAYTNINPMVLYENYGITSYVRGNSQQMIWQSYYLLKETLTYEKPKIVVLNISEMQYDKVTNEGYNRLLFDKMKNTSFKFESLKESMTSKENILEYIFPLLRYHSRWDKLTNEDFTYFFNKNKISYNGYQLNTKIKKVETLYEPKKLGNYNFSERNMDYLQKIIDLCKEENIELILMKAPSLLPYWYNEYDYQIVNISTKNNVKYINFQKFIEEIGLDYSVDTFDAGYHLNATGAYKFTDFLGKYLKDNYDFQDAREDKKTSEIYNKKLQKYREDLLRRKNEENN